MTHYEQKCVRLQTSSYFSAVCINSKSKKNKKMRENSACTALFWLLLAPNVAMQSTTPKMHYLPLPTNITVTMPDMFHMVLKWDHAAANCTPQYNVTILSLDPRTGKKTTTNQSSWRLAVYPWLDLNDCFSTGVQAYCNDMTSQPATRRMQLAPGDERTRVKTVTCVWQYEEYINCTWQPPEEAPRNIQYRLLYCLEDLLRTGTKCQEYYPPDGKYLGCTFRYEYNLKDHKELMFAVTDTSYSIKPYFYYTNANDIAKPRSPIIRNVSKPINNTFHVTWTASPNHKVLVFQVDVFSEKWHLPPFKVTGDTSAEMTIPNSDDTFSVKVRARFSEYATNNLIWSEWSAEWVVEGKAKNITPVLLFTLIPAVVLVAAVILLVYLKRLKILICPPIPHPGKMLQNDLQHWLRSERPAHVYDRTEKEEISALSFPEA